MRLGHLPGPAARSALPEGWEELSILAFDVETTGLDPRSCRVVEIGAVLFTPSRGVAGCPSLEALVDPGVPIPARVSAIHGIRDADVAGAPSFADLAPRFEELARGALLLAHNAPFDLGFLRMELGRAGRPPLPGGTLDSLPLARAAFPGLPSYSLSRLAASLGIAARRSHRALDDAVLCAEVFIATARRLSGRD